MRSLSLALLCSLLASLAPGAALAQPGERTIAVLPFRVDRLQVNTVQRLDLLLRARVEKRSRMTVQDVQTTTSLVEAGQSLGLTCELVTTECAAEFGRIADADLVLLGLAAGYDGDVGVDLRLVDVASGVEVSRVAALLSADFDAQAERLTHLVETSFAPAEHPLRTGLARVDASGVLPAGAAVAIDGAPRGAAPFESALAGLVPGDHIAEVTLDGYEPQSVRFTLEPNATFELGVALVPGSGPRAKTPLERALPWSVAAGGGVLLISGLATAAVGAMPWIGWTGTRAEHASLNRESDSFDDDAAVLWATMEQQRVDWQGWGMPATVTGSILAGAGAVVLTGGIVWAFLDSAEVTE
jgi:hypothetical protein